MHDLVHEFYTNYTNYLEKRFRTKEVIITISSSITLSLCYFICDASFANTFSKLIPFPKTGLNKSPSTFKRSKILRALYVVGVSPFFSSLQCSGVDTGTPGLGRNE